MQQPSSNPYDLETILVGLSNAIDEQNTDKIFELINKANEIDLISLKTKPTAKLIKEIDCLIEKIEKSKSLLSEQLCLLKKSNLAMKAYQQHG